MAKFKPARAKGAPRRNTADAEGLVAVSVFLREPGRPNATKGNIHRRVSIPNAKVSEVFAAIETALFGEES